MHITKILTLNLILPFEKVSKQLVLFLKLCKHLSPLFSVYKESTKSVFIGYLTGHEIVSKLLNIMLHSYISHQLFNKDDCFPLGTCNYVVAC